MIAALSPHVVSADAVVVRRQRMRFIACCPANGCSRLAIAPSANPCTRTDCGLSDRLHAEGMTDAAA